MRLKDYSKANTLKSSIRIMTCADDIIILCSTSFVLKEVLMAFDPAARKMGLLIKQSKTKFTTIRPLQKITRDSILLLENTSLKLWMI